MTSESNIETEIEILEKAIADIFAPKSGLTAFEQEIVNRASNDFRQYSHEEFAQLAALATHKAMLNKSALAGVLKYYKNEIFIRKQLEALYGNSQELISSQVEKTTFYQEEAKSMQAQLVGYQNSIKLRAKNAADIRHAKPGGSRDKQAKMQAAWQSGKYQSRDICAEQECAALNMSFSAARRALRNIPIKT